MPETISASRPWAGSSVLQRRLALWSLYEELVRAGWLSRLGRVYAWSIAAGYALLVGYLVSEGELDLPRNVLRLALLSLSGAAGLVALAAARPFDAAEHTSGLIGLSRLRGFCDRERSAVLAIATMTVVSRAAGFPALLIGAVAIAVAPTGRAAIGLLGLFLGVAAYALVFGAALGGLSRWAALLAPRHGRSLFAVLVLGPSLAGAPFDGAPDVLAGIAWVASRVANLGGGV